MSRKRTIPTILAIASALLVTTGALAAPAAGATTSADTEGDLEVEVDEPGSANAQSCLQVYEEYEIGPVTVTYDCGLQVEVDEEWEPQPASAQTCLQVYWERQVGPVTVTYDCGFHVDYDEDWEPGSETASQPPCEKLWGESIGTGVGPVTVTLTGTCRVEVDVDENWQPGTSSSQSDDVGETAKCVLTADSDAERRACVFGPRP